ncbi:MAG: hypothetical protein KAV41_02905 [Candidatus Pacebacteria bacterium]|nr:hypothetical protein [Candidatus Paceibacterota bacterium]
MFLYKFEIDKDTCFAYWAQSLIQWNWYFNQKERDKWTCFVGELNKKENDALNFLKEVLEKEDNAYLWLWGRYSGKSLENLEEKEKWEKIKKHLRCKFEIIWQSEYPKLLIWKNKLEDYNFQNLKKDFEKINNFFGVKNGNEITVKLLFGFGKKAGGNAKKEFPNLLLLTLSGVDILDINSVIKILLHENIHLIEHNSDKDILFKKSYQNILAPTKMKQSKPSWRHLIIETAVSSIVGREVGYLDAKIGLENLSQNKMPIDDKSKSRVWQYDQKIKTVSAKLSQLTVEYLKNNKEMDENYSNQVARLWKEEIKIR